ncbi:MAG: hypothetical protein I3273_04225 [Candidatus Moeniiplasma glomeromycotorum]|nr:hypothetical protein [Candidatus Moeniiplasma glomeromycotorum]
MSEESQNNSSIKVSNKTQELINSTSSKEIERIENNEKVQKEHEKEKDELREVIRIAEEKAADANREKERIKNKLLAEETDKKALEEALIQQKQKYSTLTEPEERLSYGDKVSKGAYELILKRCQMGYYGGEPCRECKSTSK